MSWRSTIGLWLHWLTPNDATSGRSARIVYRTRSTILTSQLPVARWHEQIGDPTAADGIRHRLVHNAHSIEMRDDFMRKNRAKINA
jgi:DNA replication protein DnaC